MKTKLLATLAVAFCVAACSAPSSQPPAPTAAVDEVATIVAATLAALPPSPTLPVIAPSDTPTDIPTAVPPVFTATLPPPTAELPSATSTSTPLPASPSPTLPAPSPTPPPTGDPKNQLGPATFTDNLDTSTYWPIDPDTLTTVVFDAGQMILTALTGVDSWRVMTSPDLVDFYIEVNAEIQDCSGSDHWGLIVRIPDVSNANQGYLFGVSCDGRYVINEWDGRAGSGGDWETHIPWTANAAVVAGAFQKNRLGVMATGDLLEMYVNGVKVAELRDATFDAGRFGVYIGSDETDDLQVKYLELSYWGR